MKKIPSPEREQEMQSSVQAKQGSSPAPGKDADSDDAMAGLQADLDRFRDLALRSQADFENYKKRAAREKQEAIKYANSALLQRLVSILDNFELGLAAAKAGGQESPIYSGMVLVQKQLNDLLAENGLESIEAEGKKFDPNLHDAISHEPSESPEETVIRQTRRGYRFKDRLLRPARVVVSSGPAKK
jgi:molecular chaperone GrpE